MVSVWVESLGHSFDAALDMLAGAVTDCTAELWIAPMWAVEPPAADFPFLRPDWTPITDAGERAALAEEWVRRRSTPWSVAWHALESLDYDLSGEFGPWMPPQPFFGHPHWRDLPTLEAPWSAADILGYIEYCRKRLRDTFAEMTDEKAARPLPANHRYAGQPHARIITGMVGHTTEHAAQIRQFITMGVIAPVG